MTSLFINDLLRSNALGHAEMGAVRGGYLNGISPPSWQGSLPPEIRHPFPPGAGIGIVNLGGGTDIDPGFSPAPH
jgi:hypothetical protein